MAEILKAIVKLVYVVMLDKKNLSVSKDAKEIKLADFLQALFVPTSASAIMFDGYDRGEVAKTLKEKVIPTLGDFQAITLESKEGKITIEKKNINAMLDAVIFAVNENKAMKKRTDNSDSLFKLNCAYTSKVEKEERGGVSQLVISMLGKK